MAVIRILDEQTANQIAAGEVVERPAAAVKELIENALDAGSTRIGVETEDGGRVLIRVTDNGTGMTGADAEMALQRHATSKIVTAEDLTRLRTLGFRGEALPSIASVSHFEMVTRVPDRDSAIRLVYEGGRPIECGEVGGPVGTRITVRRLFFNTPARLKFIKSVTTELNHIVEIAGRLAMAHPGVAVRLMHNGREIFSTPGTDRGRDALAALWGHERAAALLDATADVPGASVMGFVAPPEQSRPNRAQQAFFVNRRPIVSRLLTHALDLAFRPLLPAGRFAATALFLEIPPDEIDINIHPSKAEIRFRAEREVHSAVSRAVRSALLIVPAISRPPGEYQPPPTALLHRPEAPRIDSSPSRFMPEPLQRPESFDPFGAPPLGWRSDLPEEPAPAETIEPAVSPQERDRPHDRLDLPTGSDYTGFAVQPLHVPDEPLPPGSSRNSAVELLEGMRILGQVMNTFLVGEARDGIVLIDQHVAHERILYDRLLRAHQGRETLPVQRLLLPITVTLSPREATALELRLAELARLGFDVEPFGGETFLLRALPKDLEHRDPASVLRDLAADLIDDLGTSREVMERAVDAVIASASCHGAIKAHMPLGPTEMQRLVQDLIRTENPFHCPHGRPVIVRITASELLKWFKRTG